MKKLFILFSVMIFAMSGAYADMTFTDAQSSSKPMAVLVYASWLDDANSYVQQFNNLKSQFGNKYNYVTIDVATNSAKEYNKRFDIYKMPYVLLFKSRCKIMRYLETNCMMNNQCITPRMDSFLR
ncbi:MAG: hypothetical protein MJ237_06500 [bacterium]|nr:hypothetical protein [bacterium]